MKKLLFVSFYDSSFVRSDIGILKKHFQVEILSLANSKRDAFSLLKMIIKIFWEVFRNDITYCWFADFSAYLAVKAANLFQKKVFVVVGGYEVSNLSGYGGLTDKKRKKRLKYSLTNATRILTISDFSKAEIDALNFGVDSVKINIGVDRQKKVVTKTNTIITSGSATKELFKLKGLDIFAKATAGFDDHKIKLIGTFKDEIKEKLLTYNPHLEFTGKLTHTQFLNELKEAKVYCQFSQRESFGLALLEAMNSGCIPVISEAGAMMEILGNTGFSCKYGDVENARKAIQNALESDRNDDILKRVKENFTIDLREEKLIKLINQEL